MVFKICEGILCSSFYIKEFDVIVHKMYLYCITLLHFWWLYPNSPANLVVEVGTRHIHQILFTDGFEMMQKAWRSLEEVPYYFRGLPSYFKVTRTEKSAIWIQFD